VTVVLARFEAPSEDIVTVAADGLDTGPVPPLRPGLEVLRATLIVLSLVAGTMALHLVVFSSLQHHSAQQRGYAAFRRAVAEGTAPAGPTDALGRPLRHGTPVAYLEIPAIGVHEVVGEGTTAADLTAGPGHRRDTPLPGQRGTSVVLGRQASYGGPFNRLGDLRVGATINATTGQGVARFTVVSLRRGGEPTPAPLRQGAGRLLLVSAAGPSYIPSQILRVDADLTSPALPAPRALLSPVGIAWSWHRWGRPQTWIVFFPLTALVGLSASAQALRLLPNLL